MDEQDALEPLEGALEPDADAASAVASQEYDENVEPDIPTNDEWAFDGPDIAPFVHEVTPEDLISDEVTEETPEEGENSLAKAGQSAAAAANTASQHLKEGLEAIRNVRALARQHSNARAQLEELRRELDEAMSILEHRVQIERDYDSIVSEQTAQLEAARAASADAKTHMDATSAERDRLSSNLASLKAEHEESLRPYKNLMDTTKGRSDDASVALADARRAVRNAESQANEATRRREQRVSAANRAVDNAQERLRRVQTELDKLQGDQSDAPITALPKMRDELAAERAHLDAAREEVDKVAAESQQAVEEAQARVFSLRQTLEAAERTAEDAKREASASREEYDRLYKEAKAAEEKLESAIKERTREIATIERERNDAEDRIDEIQIILDEANDIHDTPEVTEKLRERITAGQAELERQDREVKDLAQSEKHLRETTRTKRIAFFAVAAVIVIALIALVWFLVFK